MNYLKALGVFRLVAEQADAEARLSWRGGAAELHMKLDRPGLLAFFLDRYQPTPVLAPWNGGSGFFDAEDLESPLGLLRSSSGARLASYRAAIACSDQVVTSLINARRVWKDLESRKKELEKSRKPIPDSLKPEITAAKKEHDTRKSRLQIDLRQVWPDSLLDWFDTVAVFHEDGEGSYQALLGSGGNDGRLDFSNNFMQRLRDVIPFADGNLPGGSAEYLSAALFADALVSLGKAAVGQFNPGGVGGPNGTQGRFEASSRVNPWDFVLMIEGAMLFAGSAARRLGVSSSSRAVFPFTVESVAVGYGSATASEETTDGSRAELWLPLWDQPAGFAEVKQLFAEGRAQFGRRQARNAVEFALAVNLLGVSRGVKSFARYGFLKRNGLAFLATPLGRVGVTHRPDARLLDDPPLVGWLDKLRSACRDKDKTPTRYQTALRQIDRALFAFANRSEQGNDKPYLLEVLAALGRAERILAGGLSFCREKYLRPLQGLSSHWLRQADDGSPEFRLAVALAGIRPAKDVGPLRVFLEEVEVKKFVSWFPGSTSAVWSKQPLAANLAAVFRRRQMEAFRAGLAGVPLDAPCPACLDDVIAFLSRETDDDKLSDLLWGLLGLDWAGVTSERTPKPQRRVPPEYGIPRLLVQERGFVQKRVPVSNPRPNKPPTHVVWRLSKEIEPNARPDPPVFDALTSNRQDAVSEGVSRAALRLKSSGLIVTGYRNRQQMGRQLGVVSAVRPEQLLAAMLFPLSDHDLVRIANTVLYRPQSEEE
jgi:CRISPR-associated protein Csx17